MGSKRIDSGGVGLHVLDEGEGQPVILLHGFPDTSALWRHQIAALTSAGYRAIAPDLRGFGESDRPEAVADYSVVNAVLDVKAIMDALGVGRAHVVGHDFGAGVAWMLATIEPARVDRLVAISVGHPACFTRPVIGQLKASWYTFLFQFAGIAEDLLMRDDWRLMRDWAASSPDIERELAALARPGALTAGLNWYRANVTPEIWAAEIPFPKIEAPTLAIWGSTDFALTEQQVVESESYVAGPWRYERFEGAGHWVQLDQPERLNDLLLEFFAAG